MTRFPIQKTPESPCGDPPFTRPSGREGLPLRNVLHDLKTPLSGIVMSLELLKTAELSGEPAEWLRTAFKSAETLAEMLADLDTEENHPDPEEKGSFLELLQTLVDVHRPLAYRKGLELHFHCTPEIRHPFLFSVSRWRRIVGNLLSNAIKFTSGGWVALEVCVENTPDAPLLRLQVEDTGCGIGPEEIPHIFRPHFRGAHPALSCIPGTGLGLSIVKSLLEEVGGEIHVASRIGHGSTFVIRSPLNRPPV